MPHVFIPPLAQSLTSGVSSVEVRGSTVREVVEALEMQFPGIRSCLCSGENLASGLNVVVDQSVSPLGMRQPVQPNSEIHFLPSLGGG